MNGDLYNIDDIMPEKGKDIIAIHNGGFKVYCFRCNCPNPNCKEWRCSVTGYKIDIDVQKWIYEDQLLTP